MAGHTPLPTACGQVRFAIPMVGKATRLSAQIQSFKTRTNGMGEAVGECFWVSPVLSWAQSKDDTLVLLLCYMLLWLTLHSKLLRP